MACKASAIYIGPQLNLANFLRDYKFINPNVGYRLKLAYIKGAFSYDGHTRMYYRRDEPTRMQNYIRQPPPERAH